MNSAFYGEIMMISRLTRSERRPRFPVRFVGLGLCCSFVLFFFWPHPPAAWLLLGVAVVLTWVRLEIALALLPLAFPYYLDLKPLVPGGAFAFSVGELGILVCVGVALLRNALLPGERIATRAWLRRSWQEARPLLLPALLFLLGASLAVAVSPDRHESLRAYREEIIEPLLYFILIVRYLQTRVDLARAVGALVLSALIAAGMGIVQGLFHIKSELLYVDANTFRVNGPYGSPNNLALLLDRTLPILLALVLVGLFRRPANNAQTQKPAWQDPLRWICGVAMLPLVWALYWTGSRGADLALVSFVFLLFVFEVRNWIAVGGVLAVTAAGTWLFRSRITGFLSASGHGVLSERLLLWKAGLLMIRDHFLLGTGPDSFNTLYKPTAHDSYALKALDGQPFPASYNPQLSHPHNFALDVWISTGLLGFAAFLWLLGAFAVVLGRAYRLCAPLRTGTVLQSLLIGIAGSMVVTVVHGLVDNSYFVPDLAMLFWFFVGLLLVIQGIALREGKTLQQKAQRATQPSEVLSAEIS